ncbi:MAG TPA: hypothetical protein VMS96_12165 [Terriglobales bacterium]|nr:hypothetical protein [Terriglobales bacterium]
MPPNTLARTLNFRALSRNDCEGHVLSGPDPLQEGLKQLGMGEPARALVYFQRALEDAPHDPDAHVGIGVAYALTSQIYPAIDHLTCAAQLEPQNFHAHLKLAQLYFKLRVPQKGYEAADRALGCATTMEERAVLARLLKEERQREREGISRPWFNKRFGGFGIWLAAAGTLALLVLVMCVH